MSFTEFCCRSGGSNLNAGTKTGNSTEPGTGATYTSTNGNWDGTSIFIPTDGSTPASTIAVGDFASVFLDAATVAVYIGRVTVVAAGVNGPITISTTAKSGTAPAVGVTGRSIKIGGAWKGPNAAEGFPFGFITNALTNVAADPPRVNLKNDAQYNITAATPTTSAGIISYQGYTTAYADLGKATIDGGTSGTSFILMNLGGSSLITDIIFQNNGASAAANLVTASGSSNNIFTRCVFHDGRGNGCNQGSGTFIECEAYNCNQSNTVNFGGFSCTNVGQFIRCISHDNAGSNGNGFVLSGGQRILLVDCIADSNAGFGYYNIGTSNITLLNCDAYNNTSDGFNSNATTPFVYIENSNFIKNGGYGINGAGTEYGMIVNCGFGTGSQANSLGDTHTLESTIITGSVSYPSGATPYVNPANGNFSINLPQAINAGRGTFTETQASYTGTVGFPVIGAAQALVSLMVGFLRLMGVGRF